MRAQLFPIETLFVHLPPDVCVCANTNTHLELVVRGAATLFFFGYQSSESLCWIRLTEDEEKEGKKKENEGFALSL